MSSSPAPHYIRTARWLGFAGLIPFVVCTLVLIEGRIGVRELALEGLVSYGAVILGFMGAVHWGRAMFAASGAEAARAFGLSVVPALLGWFATFLTARLALSILAAAFVGLYLYDRAVFGAMAGNSTRSSGHDLSVDQNDDQNQGHNQTLARWQAQAIDWYLPLRLRLTAVVVICLLACVLLL